VGVTHGIEGGHLEIAIHVEEIWAGLPTRGCPNQLGI